MSVLGKDFKTLHFKWKSWPIKKTRKGYFKKWNFSRKITLLTTLFFYWWTEFIVSLRNLLDKAVILNRNDIDSKVFKKNGNFALAWVIIIFITLRVLIGHDIVYITYYFSAIWLETLIRTLFTVTWDLWLPLLVTSRSGGRFSLTLSKSMPDMWVLT